ncbi:Hachiman antiphage defense system protein HamA, partial [Vibrio anguillarum]|uniref:Hachiman antiphage defense system protein HamA n=1 Tax=Vibrio anguillarum TaxID=55601 RepID=UPI001BE47C5E
TKHFKYSNEETKKALSSLIICGEPGPNARLNHACLIGYNYKDFSTIDGGTPRVLTENFVSKFQEEGLRLTKSLQKKIANMNCNHLSFEFFSFHFPQ